MTLILALAVLAALALGCPTPHDPVPWGPLRTWLVALSILGVSLLATAISLRTARRVAIDPNNLLKWLSDFARWQKIHAMIWIVVTVVVLFWIDWPTVVRTNLGMGGYILLDEMLILVPLLLPWALSWAAFYEVEAALRPAHASLPRPHDHARRRCRYVWEQARLSWAIALLPILWILTVLDVVRIWWPEVVESSNVFIVCGLALLALAIGFPWLLRAAWAAKPLPPGLLRKQLVELARRSGVKLAEILWWPTGGRIVNAAVTGTFANSRFVLLSDALLDQLRPNEVECVFAHELAHVRGRHVLWRVLWIMLPMPAMGAVCGPLPNGSGVATAANSELWLLGGLVLTLAYVMFGFSWFCRRLEHAADLAAIGLLSQDEPTTRAMERYTTTLRLLDVGPSSRLAAWVRLHPSLDQRVAFLQSRVART